ncbi:hypothetical protein Tco_0233213 [Tanacetum coccineum]
MGRLNTVQLNRGLKESNYVQPVCLAKSTRATSHENKMMLEGPFHSTQQLIPHALMSNVTPSPTQIHKTSSNPRNQAKVQDDRVVVQNVQGRQNRGQCNIARGAGMSGYGGALNKVGNANPGQARQVKGYNCNAQENRVTLDKEWLLFLVGGQDNTVDEDVRATYPVYDEADLSFDSDIISEVHDHDHYQDAVCEHREEHEMHDDVQPNYVVDSHADYTSNSNMIPYDQYVKDNAVVQSNVSSVKNDAYMKDINEMCESSYPIELYERWARFELTEREQKIDEQLRIVITDRNIKEENLKKELHSVKLQLASTINHNKSMVEEVTSLKKDFKQKENKYLEEFLDMKALKEKSRIDYTNKTSPLQNIHDVLNQKPLYNELNKVAISYKNPLCLTCAKQVQPALYNGYEIVQNNHVPAIVHNTEDIP